MGIECQYKDHIENDDNSYIYTESRIKKKLGKNLASFIESLLFDKNKLYPERNFLKKMEKVKVGSTNQTHKTRTRNRKACVLKHLSGPREQGHSSQKNVKFPSYHD